MDFGLSSEQEMLRDAVARYLGDHGALARTRAFAANKETRAGDVIAEIHVNPAHAAAVPEVLAMLGEATTIAGSRPPARRLILERV